MSCSAIVGVGRPHRRRHPERSAGARRAAKSGTRSAAEPDLCTRLKCPHFDRCFLFRARRPAAEADVVVVNHHLLAADLSVRQALRTTGTRRRCCRPTSAWCWTRRTTWRTSPPITWAPRSPAGAVRRLLGRFERNGKGLLPTLCAMSCMSHDDLLSRASLDLLHAAAAARAGRCAPRPAEAMFLRLHARLEDDAGGQLRLDDDFADDPVWAEGLGAELDATLGAFRRLRDDVETIADRMTQAEMTERRGPSCCRSCAE